MYWSFQNVAITFFKRLIKTNTKDLISIGHYKVVFRFDPDETYLQPKTDDFGSFFFTRYVIIFIEELTWKSAIVINFVLKKSCFSNNHGFRLGKCGLISK